MDDVTKQAIETLATELSPNLATKVSEAVGDGTATALTPLQKSIHDVSENTQQLLEAVSTLAQHNHEVMEGVNRLPDRIGGKLAETEEKISDISGKATETQQKLDKTFETLTQIRTSAETMAEQQNVFGEALESMRQAADSERTSLQNSRKQQQYVLFGILGVAVLHLILALVGVL